MQITVCFSGGDLLWKELLYCHRHIQSGVLSKVRQAKISLAQHLYDAVLKQLGADW